LNFIHDDFLLHSEVARRLYHDYAANQPIVDYHSHLPSADIAADRQFQNLFEIWLEGDHYKWRAMRANGIPERYCTGDAPPYEKFLAWARTVPYTLRNPLYQWTHLELKRYFGIDELLDERNARPVWDRANSRLEAADLERAAGRWLAPVVVEKAAANLDSGVGDHGAVAVDDLAAQGHAGLHFDGQR